MSKRILVVDDDKHARRAFTYALKGSGYEVECVDSGRLAISRVQAQHYDLILLDLNMPEMDGVDTLWALQRECPTVPVYIVTAYEEAYMARLREAAASGLRFEVAAKPLDDVQIRAIVEAMLNPPAVY